MSSLGLPTTSAYGSLVAKARRALQQNDFAWESSKPETPSALPQRNMRASADGGPLVKKDPSLRLVGVSQDKALHTELATKLEFPSPESRYKLSPDCVAAIEKMASSSGENLARWRAQQMRTIAKIAHACLPISAWIFRAHQDVTGSVKDLRRPINVAFIAALSDASQYRDEGLVLGLTRGFKTAGDLRGQRSFVMRPSSELDEILGTVWSQVPTPSGLEVVSNAALSDALRKGQRSFSRDELFDLGATDLTAASCVAAGDTWYRPVPYVERWDMFSSEEASIQWLHECSRMLRRSLDEAQRHAASGSPDRLDLIRATVARTHEEVASGFLGPAMSTDTLQAQYRSSDGFRVRVAPRFGIWQGFKMVIDDQGVETFKLDAFGHPIPKLRCIDDLKLNGTNAVTWVPERLVMPNFEFPARVAAEFSRLCPETRPELILALDDLASAYRRVPNADSRRFAIVGVPDPDSGEISWHETKGLVFGSNSSPLLFSRIPAALCAFARLWFACAVDHFVDDFIQVDRGDSSFTERASDGTEKSWSSSAQWALSTLCRLSGFSLEEEKRKPGKPTNILLGVHGDLSEYGRHNRVKFSPTRRRCTGILQTMSRCKEANQLWPREAAALLGKLNFVLSTAYASVGRAATQPLALRASGHDRTLRHRTYGWSRSLEHMRRFFEALFLDIPHLEFDFSRRRTKPVVVYTDASFSEKRNGIGVIVFDKAKNQRFVCDSCCPKWLMRVWNDSMSKKQRNAHINKLELLALVSAVWTLGPSMFQHREVIFFCDNSSALGAAVNGYTRSPHMASLSNALHLALAALRCSAFFEWVPSDANCADLPSRPQGVAEQHFYDDLGLKRWPGGLRFPNDKQLSDPQLRDVFAR